MTLPPGIVETPLDSRALGIDTYEITSLSEEILAAIDATKGHFSVRVDPLFSSGILHKHRFYYCDTLVEPYCSPERFNELEEPEVSISAEIEEDDLLAIGHGVFVHGRFHRDFQIDNKLADLRYDLWLKDLYRSGSVMGLMYRDRLAGFFGMDGNKVVLNAVASEYRGKGLAKYLWSAACVELFAAGHSEIKSSVSVSNLAVMNVYAALGFSFRNPLDIYHRLNE